MFAANISSTSSSVDSSSDQINEEDNGQQQQLVVNNSNSQNNNRLNMIISYGKELLCIIAFILTTFASVQNNSPKISRAVQPSPFFPQGSLVDDYYLGQLTPTQTKVSLSEISFVLYYAPWCSESQHSREAFDHVARVFYRDAYFSAINCWQPGSECRNQYSKIHSWPILMAYQRNGFGVQYQKNLWTEGALTKFVTSMLNPMKRLVTPDDLLESMTSKDAMIVGFLNVDEHRKHFNVFHRTALKFLERDPFNEVQFSLVTGESAMNFGVSMIPSIRAYMWNETLEYNGNFSSKEIIRWVNENLHQVSIYVSPPGSKASTLGPYYRHGPVLIHFTPRNYYSEISDSYVMLQQIGMAYFNCKNDDWVQEMSRDYLSQRRKENRDNQEITYENCRASFKQSFTDQRECNSKVSISFSNVLNTSKNVEAKIKNLPNFCGIDEVYESCGGCEESSSCGKLKYSAKSNVKKDNKKYETSMLDSSDDDRSPEAIERYNFRKKCEMLKIQERKSEAFFIDDENSSSLQLVTGLACEFNRSLSLLTLDSVNFHSFAERLGVNILELDNKTAAVILDNEFESTYILDEPANLNSISKFIYRFHHGGLTRNIRSSNVKYKHTHFFDPDEFLNDKIKQNLKKKTEKITRKSCEKQQQNDDDEVQKHITIKEINSDEFEKEIIKSNKTSVVLFMSTNCAFCSLMSHSMLTSLRVLKDMNVEFIKIDGDKNDFLWHYTMSEYPSLVIFPEKMKAESRKFPSELSVNSANILWFILANLSPSERLLGLVKICNYKRMNSTNDCVVKIQEEITDQISHLLREWRNKPRNRTAILRVIRQLKENYLKLFEIRTSCDFIDFELSVKRMIDKWPRALKL